SALLLAQPLAQLAHGRRRDQPERVVVGARADRRQHLVRFGGGEDEQDVFRRLLHELEQRVEARRGDHVGLVDDVDLVARLHRREDGALAQLAGVVHTAVGGRVYLDDVARAVPGRPQGPAGVALPARLGGGPGGAVQGAGEDARRGGLAAAPRPGEEIGVVEAPGADRVDERLGDVLLADDFGEGLRPVFAVQRECHGFLQLCATVMLAEPRSRLHSALEPRYGAARTWRGATGPVAGNGTRTVGAAPARPLSSA